MFIVSVAQHIKFGDLSIQHGGIPLSSDAPAEEMEIDFGDDTRLPNGVEPGNVSRLSRDEERALARDSTAGFAGTLLNQSASFRRLKQDRAPRLDHIALQAGTRAVRKPS